jgi:hypothetical protein
MGSSRRPIRHVPVWRGRASVEAEAVAPNKWSSVGKSPMRGRGGVAAALGKDGHRRGRGLEGSLEEEEEVSERGVGTPWRVSEP